MAAPTIITPPIIVPIGTNGNAAEPTAPIVPAAAFAFYALLYLLLMQFCKAAWFISPSFLKCSAYLS